MTLTMAMAVRRQLIGYFQDSPQNEICRFALVVVAVAVSSKQLAVSSSIYSSIMTNLYK